MVWFGLGALSWLYLLPDLSRMTGFQFDWIVQIYAKNFELLCLFAGGMHIYFHSRCRQGKKRKFEGKDSARNNSVFLFKVQVKDNMFWSLASDVAIWTVYEVFYFWCFANGFVPGVTFAENPVWFVLWFPLMSLWGSFHFYWVHRLIHWPPLYKAVHALHHRNINIGPWTGISMHPVEQQLYFSNITIHFVVASHPLHVLYHMFFQGIGPSTSHSGFANLMLGDKSLINLGNFFHQLHTGILNAITGRSRCPWATGSAAIVTARLKVWQRYKQSVCWW